MTISLRLLLKNTSWTVGAFGVALAIRFASNVILARLLAPELFGIMSIVTSVKLGIEFISDVGIGQNIVFDKNANDPDFYNTAWTIQAIRSLGLWLIALILAVPIARFYESPILVWVLPLVVFNSVFFGFSALSMSLMQKRLQIAKLNLIEVVFVLFCAVTSVLFAYVNPSIWAMVFAGLFQCAIWMISTHYFLPDVKHRFHLSKQYTWDILHFGKWIFVSSIVFFLSTNFDRLYFAKVVGFEVLGVYGIARSIAELLGAMISRVGNFVLFPLIASHQQMPRSELRDQLGSIRAKSLLLVGAGYSLIVTFADLPIKILYDERYQAAAWMLPILITGSWFSLLANLNESTLLGLGRPSYSAIGNCSKFIFLLIGLPLSIGTFGLLGGVTVIAVADLFRYFPIIIGQTRERFSFVGQDLLITIAVLFFVSLWEWVRSAAGLGNSFESLPTKIGAIL